MTMSNMMQVFMLISIMTTMVMIISSTLTNSIHPLMLILILVIYTILNLFTMYLMTSMSTYMYMYMMFISIIGGMMIMFLYFTSMINNYPSKIKMNELMVINFTLMIMLLLTMIYMYSSSHHLEIHLIPKSYMSPSTIMIFKIYIYPLNLMTVTTILNLLYCLILTIKMCSSKYTPLRKINYEKI